MCFYFVFQYACNEDSLAQAYLGIAVKQNNRYPNQGRLLV